jgi:hypothetical protein
VKTGVKTEVKTGALTMRGIPEGGTRYDYATTLFCCFVPIWTTGTPIA